MTITFHYCNCGLTDDYFSETIMIYAPCRKATLFVNVDNLPNQEQSSVDDLLTYIKNHLSEFDTPLGDLEFKDVNAESVYLYYDDFLLKIGEKRVCEVFSDFKCEEIELYYFSFGGASIEYKNGYRFIIHSDEKIHQQSEPHVHVEKNHDSPRYSLVTFERFPQDKFESRDYKRDHKLIQEGLKKNRDRLMKMWQLATKGYGTPEMGLDGRCYYAES